MFCVKPCYQPYFMIGKLRIKDPSDFVFCHLIKLPEVKDCGWVLKHEVPVKDVSSHQVLPSLCISI